MVVWEASPPMFGPPSTHLPKPPVPYTRGWLFRAKVHTPPPPTLVVEDCHTNSNSDVAERWALSATERCLKHPPLPGVEGTDTVSLEIIEPLKVGDGHHSQVFTIRVVDSPSELLPVDGDGSGCTQLVAKVYDPLYLNDDDGYLNPFLCVDHDYTHEANTYTALGELQGKYIPKYYGSYTLEMAVDRDEDSCSDLDSGSDPDSADEQPRTRTVRMILIEYIHGITMSHYQPQDFPQSARQAILKSIVDIESQIYEKDLLLLDIHPRNVIIMYNPADSSSSIGQQPRAVLVDFADVLFNRRRDDPLALLLNYFLGEYISPLLRWKKAHYPIYRFEGWVDWDWDWWLEAEFPHTAATITPEMRERWSDD